MPVLDLATVLMSGRPCGACVRLEVEWKRFLETFLETFQTLPRSPTMREAGGVLGGGPWALGPRAPAEGSCWTIGRLVPCRVLRARACSCAALRLAAPMRRSGPRGRCGPGCRRQSSMLAQQHAAAPRR